MAEVVVHQNVVLKVTDREWRLIMKALAMMAGVKNLTCRIDEQVAASDLNRQLLGQRVNTLREQLNVAEAALTHTVVDDESVDTLERRMAYAVGRQVGLREQGSAVLCYDCAAGLCDHEGPCTKKDGDGFSIPCSCLGLVRKETNDRVSS